MSNPGNSTSKKTELTTWPKRKPASEDTKAWRKIMAQAPPEVVKSVAASLIAKRREYKIAPVDDPKLAHERERNRRKSANYRARKAQEL